MRTGLIFLFILNSTAMALEYGECEALPNTKNYISSDFSAHYPKNVTFSCKYRCAGQDSVQIIEGNSTVHVANVTDDAKKVVCQGVKVIDGKWGYEYDGVTAFYAFDTKIRPIKAWAFSSIDRNPELELVLLENLKKQLRTIATSYAIAGSTPSKYAIEFLNAAQTLSNIAQELPQSTELLDKQIQLLVELGGQTSKKTTAQSLTLNVVKTLGSWLNPHHLYK